MKKIFILSTLTTFFTCISSEQNNNLSNNSLTKKVMEILKLVSEIHELQLQELQIKTKKSKL